MRLFRQKTIRQLLTLLAGITFLNMSFILAEIAMLELDKTDSIFQNLSTSGFEEERESGGETNEDPTSKELDLLSNHNLLHHHILYVSASKRGQMFHDLMIHDGHKKTFSPPPEVKSV